MAIKREDMKPGITIYLAETWDGDATPSMLTRTVISVGKGFVSMSSRVRPEGRAERVSIYTVLARYSLTKRAALLALVEKLENTIEASKKAINDCERGLYTLQDMIDKLDEPEASPLTDVHTAHCCVRHGCKYGDDDCTVTTRHAPMERDQCRVGAEESEPCREENKP